MDTKTLAQIERFRKGFPWLDIVAPATPGKGIEVLDEQAASEAAAYADKARVAGKCKFVPASGAASRMFKDIFAGMDVLRGGADVPAGSPVARLAASIRDFAFYTEEVFGTPEDSPAYRRKVAENLLTDSGLDYGSKPKGVLKFHRYPQEVRTALAEHLVEAQEYMRNADGSCNLTVTISPEHRPLFEAALAEVKPVFEQRYGVRYNLTFTYQDKATDTVAVTPDNEPFLDENGQILRRPAGHGALIYNLNQVEDELVSIKNIDNVAHERFLPVTARYKKVLMGRALALRDRIFGFLQALDAESDPCSASCIALCDQIEAFLAHTLCVSLPGVSAGPAGATASAPGSATASAPGSAGASASGSAGACAPGSAGASASGSAGACASGSAGASAPGSATASASGSAGACAPGSATACASAAAAAARVALLRAKLNRPIRVCGMVKNQGEPGGGPFIIRAADGSTSLQILESVQINKENPAAVAALSSATHFNPVDLVCCLRNYKGEKFNLLEHVDEETGFISSKSYKGRELKALELPGLWNGSMSDWNTLFVEVPLETFNPVKTVLDLLRPAHQA